MKNNTIIINRICNPYWNSCLESAENIYNEYFKNKNAQYKIIKRRNGLTYCYSLIARFEDRAELSKFAKMYYKRSPQTFLKKYF